MRCEGRVVWGVRVGEWCGMSGEAREGCAGRAGGGVLLTRLRAGEEAGSIMEYTGEYWRILKNAVCVNCHIGSTLICVRDAPVANFTMASSPT